jgi:bifunctional NMN adenylyltransferase/nudix hydrolase
MNERDLSNERGAANERDSANADVAVITGRWQILQRGHCGLLRAALATAPKVVVVIGSAWHSRDSRNPFTWQERQQQFEAVLTPEQRARVSFVPVRDYFNDERWSRAVRAGVANTASHHDRVVLIGFKKDHTSGYLDNFPGWSLVEIEPVYDISSSDLRSIYFELEDRATALTTIGNYVEPGVRAYLDAWSHLPAYRKCAAEHQAVAAYKKKYTAPFALTSDCVVTASGHVLLIRRGGNIGNGLWALPGGFIETDETFYAAAVRELAEETGFRTLPSRMKEALRGQAIFDHPLRSARGRIVTNAFHFDLGDAHRPDVRGSDDAKEARWISIAELPALEEQLFEDHATILDHFLGLWPGD